MYVCSSPFVVTNDDCIEQDSPVPNHIDHLVCIDPLILDRLKSVILGWIGVYLSLFVGWSALVQ